MVSAKTKHIAVVGAGVIGVSIAYFLSRRPNTVIEIFEQDIPGFLVHLDTPLHG